MPNFHKQVLDFYFLKGSRLMNPLVENLTLQTRTNTVESEFWLCFNCEYKLDKINLPNGWINKWNRSHDSTRLFLIWVNFVLALAVPILLYIRESLKLIGVLELDALAALDALASPIFNTLARALFISFPLFVLIFNNLLITKHTHWLWFQPTFAL